MIVPEPGQWQAVAVGGDIPAQIGGKDVASLMFIPVVNGFVEGDNMFIDDASLFRLGDIEE